MQPLVGDPDNRGFYMNSVRNFFSFEDMIKRRCPSLANIDLNVLNQQLRVRIGECLTTRLPFANVDPGATPLPSNASISGSDYTTVLRTNGDCVDVDVKRTGCALFAKDDAPGMSDYGLAGGPSTPVEVLEQLKPHFVMASVGGNHALGCALTTLPLDTCLDWGRFEEDATETFDRLAKIQTIQGGLVFGVPSLASLAHLRAVTYRVPRVEFPSHAPPLLRMVDVSVKIPYWRAQEIEQRVQTTVAFVNSFGNFIEALASPLESLQGVISLALLSPTPLNDLSARTNQLSADIQATSLDATEVARLDTFTRAMNAKLAELSARNGYAYVDAYAVFQTLKDHGVPVLRPNGSAICTARGDFPLAGQAANGKGCGVFSLERLPPESIRARAADAVSDRGTQCVL